jgi:hypothetical protein
VSTHRPAEKTYFRELALALRGRRIGEQEVTDALQEVQGESRAAGRHPEDVFGAAKTYAATFPTGKKRSIGGWLIQSVMFLGALALAVSLLVNAVITDPDGGNPWLIVQVFGLALVSVAVAAVVGSQLDSRLPKGMTF